MVTIPTCIVTLDIGRSSLEEQWDRLDKWPLFTERLELLAEGRIHAANASKSVVKALSGGIIAH